MYRSAAEGFLVRCVALRCGEDCLEHVTPTAERADAEPLHELLHLRERSERRLRLHAAQKTSGT